MLGGPGDRGDGVRRAGGAAGEAAVSISTKVGLHIIGGYAGPLISPAGAAPRVIVLHECSTSYYHDIRRTVGPDTYIVIRWTWQPNWDNPTQSAHLWHQTYAARINACRHDHTLFQGANEIPDALAARYRIFEAERIEILHQVAANAAIGAWSVGCPDLPTWYTYAPLLAAMRGADALLLHEYWVDNADIQNHWHCARWRLVPAIRNKRIIVGECGRDVVESRGKRGWRKTCSPAQFIEDLRAYGRLIASHPNVLGAAVFTAGNDRRWKDFAVDDIWPQVVAQYADDSPAPPPPPPPPPPPTIEARVAALERRVAALEARRTQTEGDL